jgi:hypothetical protein
MTTRMSGADDKWPTARRVREMHDGVARLADEPRPTESFPYDHLTDGGIPQTGA